MSVDFLGLLLAILTAIIASMVTVFLLSVTWSSLGFLSLLVGAVAALLVLALGAMIHAMLTSNNRL